MGNSCVSQDGRSLGGSGWIRIVRISHRVCQTDPGHPEKTKSGVCLTIVVDCLEESFLGISSQAYTLVYLTQCLTVICLHMHSQVCTSLSLPKMRLAQLPSLICQMIKKKKKEIQTGFFPWVTQSLFIDSGIAQEGEVTGGYLLQTLFVGDIYPELVW